MPSISPGVKIKTTKSLKQMHDNNMNKWTPRRNSLNLLTANQRKGDF